jgi:hypothetical protein
MENVPTTQIAVFDAIVARVRTLTQFGTENCYVSDDPHAEIPALVRKKIACLIYPMEGSYGEPEYEGGGDSTVIEYTGFTAALYVDSKLRQSGKPYLLMSDPVFGLWTIKRELLKLFCGKWLENGSGKSLLTQQIQPIFGERPTIQGEPVGDLALSFSTPFQWELIT